jgi:hypothetical protein
LPRSDRLSHVLEQLGATTFGLGRETEEPTVKADNVGIQQNASLSGVEASKSRRGVGPDSRQTEEFGVSFRDAPELCESLAEKAEELGAPVETE